MTLERKWNYDSVEHVRCRAVSSQEDRHWEPFLTEAKDGEADIDKLQSEDSNLQSGVEPKEFNTDIQN